MKRAVAVTISSLALIVAGAIGAPAASASEPVPDPQIAEMLEAVPGGVIVDEFHAVWPELDMELSVPAPVSTSAATASMSAAAVGACPTGRVCAFSLSATNGARLSWSSCGTSFPVGSFTVRSIADARSSGYAQARYGTIVRATASAGHWTNVYGTVSRIRCVS